MSARATLPLQRYLGGGIMVVTGLAAALEARTFGMGTMARMGPGLYPTCIGVALAVVGILIALAPDDAEAHDAAASGRPDWRGWACILGGVVAFILLGEHFGLGPGTFACVLISAMGDRRATPRSAFLLAAGATLAAAVVFSWILKFQLPFWRW